MIWNMVWGLIPKVQWTLPRKALDEIQAIHWRHGVSMRFIEGTASLVMRLERVINGFITKKGWDIRWQVDATVWQSNTICGIRIIVNGCKSVSHMIEFNTAVLACGMLKGKGKGDDMPEMRARTFTWEIETDADDLRTGDGQSMRHFTGNDRAVNLHIRYFVDGESCRFVKVGEKTEDVLELKCGARVDKAAAQAAASE